MERRALAAARMGISVIYDATNLSARRRKHMAKQMSVQGCATECVVCVATFEVCCERQLTRGRKVPTEVIDMVRVACYIHQIPAAVEMINYFNELGYETTCNIMAISQASFNQIDDALEMLGESKVDVIYLVDSYGSLFPENAAELAKKYLEYGEKYGKKIGFHGHNNQNLAFANTIETLSYGVSYVDATALSMGRGAGNCAMELMLGFLKNPKYSIYSLLRFIENYMLPLKESGVVWGFDLQYMFTGQLNRHPREAMNFTDKKRNDYTEFYKELLDNY